MSRRISELILCLAGIAKLTAQTSGPPAVEPASLSGVVTNTLTGAPVQRAHVTIRSYDNSSKQLYGAMTTGEGKFSIAQLPAGHYKASVERVGFTMPPNQAASVTDVTLSPGDAREDFKLTLVPTGSIRGRVLDATGEPVQGVSILAERGLGFERATTDDKGQFRVGGLYPGKYRVKAIPQTDQFMNLPPETRTDNSKEFHYSPTYYPESLLRNQATRIDVQPAVELAGIDIRLVRTPVVSVSGRVIGFPLGAAPLQITANGGASRSASMVKPDGTFVFWRLDPGKYTLTTGVFATGPLASLRSAPMEIEVDGANLEHIEVRMIPPFDIPVQLHFEDQQPSPTPKRFVTLGMVTAESNFDPPRAEIAADDSVTLEKVPPGIYHVSIMGRPTAYVKSIRVGPVETEGDILDVRNGLAGPVAVLISTNTCQVRGTVSDSSGPVAGARVLLQPADRVAAPHGYLVTTTRGGTYTIADVIPGKYRLLVVDDDALAAFQRGLDLEDYEDVTESLDLQAGDKIAKDLTQRK